MNQSQLNTQRTAVAGTSAEFAAYLTSVLHTVVSATDIDLNAWPNDAVFAVSYDVSTWPCGWSKESCVCFFPDAAALAAWHASMCEWAQLEDNHFRYVVYEWDWGPVALPGYTFE